MKKKIKVLLICAVTCITCYCGFLLLDFVFPFPTPGREKGFALAVLASDGSPLRSFPGAKGVWRYPVKIGDVSPHYLTALVNYEDRWFRQHPGVNLWSLARAFTVYAWERRPVLGGSTLTMQTARILDPHTRTIPGKVKQIFRALQLEYYFSKDEILEFYLNYAPFGGPVEGVQAACYTYLGKPAKELSRAEAALMAVLPQAPSRLRPDRHPERARRARDKVLKRMERFGVWDRETVASAMLEGVEAGFDSRPMKAPILARRLFFQNQNAANIKNTINTTIDTYVQEIVESILKNSVSSFPPRTSGAAVVVENKTLFVKAYAGSSDFLDGSRFGCVDMVTAVRSPGSTLKPFLYALGMEEGMIHSESLIMDAPISFTGYRPGNFTKGFAGPVSVSEALIRSLNIPAVDLLDRLGPAFFDARLRQGGLKLKYPDNGKPNLSMILGGLGTTLEGLVGAYASLARKGLAGKPRFTTDEPMRERRLMDPGAAYIIREILFSNKRPDLPGGRLFLDPSRRVAWKTGTSYGYRDAWCVGVTDTHTIGVWVGRPDGTPTPGYYGRAVAAPLLFSIVDSLPRAYTAQQKIPENVSKIEICWPLGLKAPDKLQNLSGVKKADKKNKSEKTDDADSGKNKNPLNDESLCHVRKTAWILNNAVPPTLPDRNDALWLSNPRKVMINPATGLRVEADCGFTGTDTKYIAMWPRAARPWLPTRIRQASTLPKLDPACKKPAATTPDNIKIAGLEDGSILRPPGVNTALPEIVLTAIGGRGRLFWLLDGELIAQANVREPKNYQFTRTGSFNLTVMDLAGNFDSIKFIVLGGNPDG